MAKYRTYGYTPVNPEKHKGGSGELIVKSSWELEFARSLDLFPSVLSWSYETTKIPYRDPLSGRQKVYIPDFFAEVAQSDGYSKHFVFEIKPMHEQLDQHARNSKDAALVARNKAKWMAATMWADRHSAEFVVLNEKDIFSFHENRKPRVHSVKQYKPTYSTKPSTGKAFKKSAKAPNSSSSRTTSRGNAKSMSSRIGKANSIRRATRAKKI
jgi:hypothetical protein